ncbi:MAG TPA: type II secretion system protein [Acidimicrobiales bacterium]|nr:type II secretion system protein [Acidimicrobiales bacterium]
MQRAREVLGEDEGAEAGFTLIELMVVLLIMAILMAIAIPTFLGVRAGAQDRSTQSDLVNSAISLKSLFAVDGQFHSAVSEVSELQSSEPEMNFSINPVTSSNPSHQIEVIVSPDQLVILLIGESATGRCWDLEENEEATVTAVPANWTTALGISYGGTLVSAGPQASCSALFPDLLPGTFTGWTRGGFPS